MGYYITLNRCDIHIPAPLFPVICEHLRTTDFNSPDNMGGGCYGNPEGEKFWFSWTNPDKVTKAIADDDLPTLLEQFRFEFSLDDKGAIVDLLFDCKQGDELLLFNRIAEVLPGTHRLDWSGEEGSMWRWLIKDNQLHVIDATINFNEDNL